MLDSTTDYSIDLALVKPLQIPIGGQTLIRRKWNYAERAFVGADLVRGDKVLIDPTHDQAAMLARCKVSAVRWALKREPYREDIIAGLRPLVPPTVRKAAPTPIGSNSPTDCYLAELASLVGPDRWLEAALAAGL
jgi:hypothetical protein